MDAPILRSSDELSVISKEDVIMTVTNTLTVEQVATQRDAFMERMLKSSAGVFDIFTVYIGDQLGLYQVLADDGPLTSSGLCAATGRSSPRSLI